MLYRILIESKTEREVTAVSNPRPASTPNNFLSKHSGLLGSRNENVVSAMAKKLFPVFGSTLSEDILQPLGQLFPKFVSLARTVFRRLPLVDVEGHLLQRC
jgi:hypothetical protein